MLPLMTVNASLEENYAKFPEPYCKSGHENNYSAIICYLRAKFCKT